MGLSKKAKKKRGYSRRLGMRRRGSGNKGGKGMAGWGKRGKQKKLKFIKEKEKKGFKSRNKKLRWINLSEISGNVELKGYKVLGKGELRGSFEIKATAFTKKAKEKIEKAGGKWIEL